jgi:hypothetical protein
MDSSQTPIADQNTGTGGAIIPKEIKKKKFMNGWTKPQEELMATWGDIAACYRWMHDKSDKKFTHLNMSMSIPIIILSTLTGTANFGIDSIVGDNPLNKKYASFVIGSVSLIAGILGTLSNFLRYAQLQESHRVAGVSWGKFQRLIAVELALHPNDRADCMDFLKLCRAELDRLIEQSPPIPTTTVSSFEKKFGKMESIQKPEICGDIDHTQVYRDNDGRLRQVASDAVMFLRQRKKFMNELMNDEIERKIRDEIDKRMANKTIKEDMVNPDEKLVQTTQSPKNTLITIIDDDDEDEDNTKIENRSDKM